MVSKRRIARAAGIEHGMIDNGDPSPSRSREQFWACLEKSLAFDPTYTAIGVMCDGIKQLTKGIEARRRLSFAAGVACLMMSKMTFHRHAFSSALFQSPEEAC